MDADSVSHMMQCEHLITDDDYEAITTAPNDIKMNCLLLQYVKMMDVKMLFKFCDTFKSIETHKSFGDTLELCKLCMCVATVAINTHYNNQVLRKIKIAVRNWAYMSLRYN